MKYKVFIPCAGLGSRVNSENQYLNKSLLTIGHKPVISHIIDKFPEETFFVIALGYKGELVKNFLKIAYPKRKFIFVEVDKFEGKDSGLGYTMLLSKDHLQCPFIFCSNDTIVKEEIPVPENNWMGYAEREDTTQYRSLRIKQNMVQEVCSKGALGNVKPYIGLAGINSFKIFWETMESAEESIRIGESFGMHALIDKGIEAKRFTWNDTGNPESLTKTRQELQEADDPHILAKDTEAIWFVDGSVIKFSVDNNFIKKRVSRAPGLYPFIPKIITSTDHFYQYVQVPGKIFSANPQLDTFKYLLDWLEHFWKKQNLSRKQKIDFKKTCISFYKDKTFKRIQDYFIRFEQIDSEEIINGLKIPKVTQLLESLDWDWISEGVAVRWHGDLHFENILINANSPQPFTLLDWRQGFGEILDYGDLYYDLAKLNHGLIICHELIHQELFKVTRKVNQIEFDFLRKQTLVECEQYFKSFVEEKGYDYQKVKAMTYLVYLNIAALHQYPYSALLFYLGKSGLYRLLSGDNNFSFTSSGKAQ